MKVQVVFCLAMIGFQLPALAATQCVTKDQFIVVENGNLHELRKCGRGYGDDLTAQPFPKEDLVRSIDRHKEESEFLKRLKDLDLGGSYDEVIRSIVSADGSKITIGGKEEERETLSYFAQILNEDSGAAARVAELDSKVTALGADRQSRQNSLVDFNAETLLAAAKLNHEVISMLGPDACWSNPNSVRNMQIFRVQFDDGDLGILIPRSVQKAGESEFRVEMQLYGTNFGDLQIGPGILVRNLKFDGNSTKWVKIGDEGAREEYSIRKVTKMSITEALGKVRSLNPSANSDDCLFATYLTE